MTQTEQQLVETGQHYLYPNYRQPPLVMVRGKGCELWDASGKRYLDLYAGIAVNTLGHAHPALASAIASQAQSLLHVSNYFYNEPNVQLAAKLCQATGMARALFSNSGTEAIEAMLKLARRHFYSQGQKDRYQVLAFEQSFHGRTMGALAATGQPGYRDGFGPLVGVVHVPFGDLEATRAAMTDDIAAILVEPVQGEGGVLPAPPGFLAALRRLCDERGCLLLADEIQTGVGRTGKFLGFEHSGVQPDAVALAKALGGGVPIGAMLCKSHLEDALPPGSHGSTFGGNALASRAALTVLEVVEQEDLLGNAARVGEHLEKGLNALANQHTKLVDSARGVGLLQALVLRPNVDVRAIHSAIREGGVLVTVAGGVALRISPALNITAAQIDEGLGIIDRVLGEASS